MSASDMSRGVKARPTCRSSEHYHCPACGMCTEWVSPFIGITDQE